MKISLCITTYQRFDMVIRSFEKVMYDSRISNIVIMDDHSTDFSYEKLVAKFKGNPKVQVHRQSENVGMAKNKRDALLMAASPWGILLDDDNEIDKSYLDALEAVPDVMQEESEIYLPSRALPNFVFDEYSEQPININNLKEFTGRRSFGALLNCCNYVAHRDFYAQTWKTNPEIKATDTIWHAYNHLKNFGSFYVVPWMHYQHNVHPGSGFLKDVHYNMAKAKEIENLLKQL